MQKIFRQPARDEKRELLPAVPRALNEEQGQGVTEKIEAGVARPTAARYWATIDDLCRAIDDGDASIGLPPYNGGLFNRDRTPLLTTTRLGDAVTANVLGGREQ